METSIQQTIKKNKNVILIGDKENAFLAKKYNIIHLFFDNYNHNDFSKYYIHDPSLDSNYMFELVCFQRRFVLLETMKALGIEQCLYLDSDILYYGNIDEEFERISWYWKYKLAFPNSSGHTTYIFSTSALKDFCNFIMSYYKDKKLFIELANWALSKKERRSDMSIFQLYIYKFPQNVFNLLHDYGDHIIYDWSLNYDGWYKGFFWKKYFSIIHDKVYIYTKDNKRIETKTLHFHMHMKTFMRIIYNKNVMLYRFYLLLTLLFEQLYYKIPIIRKLRKKRKNKHLF